MKTEESFLCKSFFRLLKVKQNEGSKLNHKRFLMFMVICTILTTTTVLTRIAQNAEAVVEERETGFFTPKYSDISITKKIIHRNGSRVETYDTFVDDSFTIEITINNFGAQDLYNVTSINPESDLPAMGYQNNWFEITNDPNNSWNQFNSTDVVVYTYIITPKKTGTFTFGAANLTYSNGTNYFTIFSNSVKFTVYESDEDVKVVKSVIIDGETFSPEGRIKVKHNFTVLINVTNFYRQNVNITIQENPLNSTIFGVNETIQLEEQFFSDVALGESVTFEYKVQALINGTYQMPYCNVSFVLSEGGSGVRYSNNITLEIYKPIYEGPDWTKKIPLLSVEKYFQTKDEDGNLINSTQLHYFNTTREVVTIIINITNAGVVPALNIRVSEPVYNDWVFETKGVPEVWFIGNLTKGQSKILNYTIFPLINGIFKIEPTTVTYDYQNQETLLLEKNNKLYSNILEIEIEEFISDPDLRAEWWISIGISVGVIFLAVIPLIISIVLYRRRRPTQKGI
ncbi:MAG: hypothetical protein DRO63_07435 [Candidatus Gerdarchaeota archaeon]|nr:MAG: hypothetical protein DRO63_07435 [Candidatus Gerdarchaeota archaeon]